MANLTVIIQRDTSKLLATEASFRKLPELRPPLGIRWK
jgi:hypothetical protein